MKNKYKIKNDYVIIYIERKNGEIFETYIDLDDFEKVNNWKYQWCINKNFRAINYAVSNHYPNIRDKKSPKTIYLHQFILDFPENCDIDHINNNPLDNRKSNLRTTPHDANNKNRKGKNVNNTSGYRNVSWFDYYQKWVVQLQVEGKNQILGMFDNVNEAGEYAEEMRQKYFGEYAGKGL